jgi:hypothetical protein
MRSWRKLYSACFQQICTEFCTESAISKLCWLLKGEKRRKEEEEELGFWVSNLGAS